MGDYFLFISDVDAGKVQTVTLEGLDPDGGVWMRINNFSWSAWKYVSMDTGIANNTQTGLPQIEPAIIERTADRSSNIIIDLLHKKEQSSTRKVRIVKTIASVGTEQGVSIAFELELDGISVNSYSLSGDSSSFGISFVAYTFKTYEIDEDGKVGTDCSASGYDIRTGSTTSSSIG